jgi:hypothetical protein
MNIVINKICVQVPEFYIGHRSQIVRFSLVSVRGAKASFLSATRIIHRQKEKTMLKNPAEKYRPYTPISLPDRRWPEKQQPRATLAVYRPARWQPGVSRTDGQ